MIPEELELRWERMVADVRSAPDGRIRGRLDGLYHDLQEDVFGGRPSAREPHPDVDPFDPRLRLLLDALSTLALLEPEDPSYPWDRALVLASVGRHLEAADDYLTAARLYAGGGADITGDGDDWARSALHAAARSLALGGEPAAAAALLPRVAPEDRADVERLLPLA